MGRGNQGSNHWINKLKEENKRVNSLNLKLIENKKDLIEKCNKLKTRVRNLEFMLGLEIKKSNRVLMYKPNWLIKLCKINETKKCSCKRKKNDKLSNTNTKRGARQRVLSYTRKR